MLENGPLSLNAALDACCQVARALEQVHARGEAHPHVHAGNVMALTPREIALVDLGPAEGTGYLSPEQLACTDLTPAANQYQLGLLLHHLLIGETPHAGLSLDQVKVCRVSGPPVSLRQADPDVPYEIDEIGRTLMAASPEARYPSMRAARMALESALEGYRRALLRTEPAPPKPRAPALVTAAMAILVAASVLVLGVHL